MKVLTDMPFEILGRGHCPQMIVMLKWLYVNRLRLEYTKMQTLTSEQIHMFDDLLQRAKITERVGYSSMSRA